MPGSGSGYKPRRKVRINFSCKNYQQKTPLKTSLDIASEYYNFILKCYKTGQSRIAQLKI